MKVFNIKTVALLTILFSFNTAVLAVDDETESKLDFTSRERLAETLVDNDEQAQSELTDAQTSLTGSQTERDDAQTALDTVDKTTATKEEIAALEQQLVDAEKKITEAEADVATAESNLATTQENQAIQLTQIEDLSDDQVFALNRSLNNAVSNKLIENIDGAFILQSVIDGDYNKLQINSLTKALEEEAKFTGLSDKFQAKFEDSNNEKFLEISDRMLSRGEMQKDKFLAKIDRFSEVGNKSDFSKDLAKSQVKGFAKASAKKDARGIAKKSALNNVKKSVKDQAKLNAKNISKQIVKEEGRRVLKENGRINNKGNKGNQGNQGNGRGRGRS